MSEGELLEESDCRCVQAESDFCSTSFFVLGLIASSIEGAVLLESCNWSVAYTPVGTPTGYCLPVELGTLIYVGRAISKSRNQQLTHASAAPAMGCQTPITAALRRASATCTSRGQRDHHGHCKPEQQSSNAHCFEDACTHQAKASCRLQVEGSLLSGTSPAQYLQV